MVTAATAGEPMSEARWRGLLDHLYYASVYTGVVDDDAIEALAVHIVERLSMPAGPDVYYQAFSQALQAERLLGPENLPFPQSEETMREIIARLLARLDARRPWPTAARFERLPLAEWPWAEAPNVATIRGGSTTLDGRIWKVFDFAKVDGVLTPVLVLRQRTGDVIALVCSTGPKPTDRRTAWLRVLQGDPARALAAFMELTGLGEDVVVPVSPGTSRGAADE